MIISVANSMPVQRRSRLVQFPGEAAQPAVNVVNLDPELFAQEGEHRIAPPAVQPGHGARQDLAAAGWQATSLHQAVPWRSWATSGDVAEIVAGVGVPMMMNRP